MSWSADNSRILAETANGELWTWKVGAIEGTTFPVSIVPYISALSADGSEVFVQTKQGDVLRIGLDDGSTTILMNADSEVTDLGLSTAGRKIVLARGASVSVIDLGHRSTERVLDLGYVNRGYVGVAFLRDEVVVYTGRGDVWIRLRDSPSLLAFRVRVVQGLPSGPQSGWKTCCRQVVYRRDLCFPHRYRYRGPVQVIWRARAIRVFFLGW